MKRTTRSLTAAVMAGAIALAATPAAHAETLPPEVIAAWKGDLPAAYTDAAGNYFVLRGTEYVKKELPATTAEIEAAPRLVQREDGTYALEVGVNAQPANPAEATAISDLTGNSTASVTVDTSGNLPVDVTIKQTGETNTGTEAQAPVRDAKCVDKAQGDQARKETTWYATKDGKHYVSDKALVDAETLPNDPAKVRTLESVQQDCVFVEGAAGKNGAAATATTTAEAAAQLSGGAIAAIAAAAVGLPIVLAGVTYFLNQDGQTLVGSSDRVHQEPTQQEKAESDRLRAQHADEIAAQEAAAATRGVEAETGSNTLARTLFALVLAIALGAAAFVAGRRFLV